MDRKEVTNLFLDRRVVGRNFGDTPYSSRSPKTISPSRTPKVRSARIHEEQKAAQYLRRIVSTRMFRDLGELPPRHTPEFYIRKAKEKRINITSRPTSAMTHNLLTLRSEKITPTASPKLTQRRGSTSAKELQVHHALNSTPTSSQGPRTIESPPPLTIGLSDVIPSWIVQRDDFLSTFAKIKNGSGIDIFQVCKLNKADRKERENMFLINWAAKIPFFANLPRHVMRDVCVKLTSVFAGKGSVSKSYAVMKQGDAGDCMYVIYKGSVEVQVYGNKVAEFTEKCVFGEGALMSRAGRTATVIALEDTQLLKLTQQDHDSVVLGAKKREKYNFTMFLHTIPFFDPWQLVKVHRLSNALISTHFTAGQVVYEKDAKSASLYIVKEGQVEIQTIIRLDESNRWPIGYQKWELNKLSKKMIVQLRLCNPKDFFGDLEMVSAVPRATRAVAVANSQCLVINREEFFNIFTQKEAQALLKYTHLDLPSERELAETVVETSMTERKMVRFTIE